MIRALLVTVADATTLITRRDAVLATEQERNEEGFR